MLNNRCVAKNPKINREMVCKDQANVLKIKQKTNHPVDSGLSLNDFINLVLIRIKNNNFKN